MITIGTITMSTFGWCALLMEAVLIWLKDCSLWLRQLNCRERIPKRLMTILIGLSFVAQIAVSELLGLVDMKQYTTIGILILLVTLELTTENGVELIGRQGIWWIISYCPFIWITLLPQFPSMMEGSRSYYQTPERILPNLLLMLFAFFVFRKVWNSKIVQRIPSDIYVAFSWISVVGSAFMFKNITGEQRVTQGHVAYVTLTYVVLVGGYCMSFVLYRIRQQHKVQLEEQCRQQFYDRIIRVKKQAGSFRHDLANHVQVMRGYGEAGWQVERQNYLAKLTRRQNEFTIACISGDAELDFMLRQLQSLGEEHQITLSFEWQRAVGQQERKEEIVGELLNWMSRIYHRRNRKYLIRIYDEQGRIGICPVRCRRERTE